MLAAAERVRSAGTTPVFELLEDRILLAAQPVVTVEGADVLMGDSAQITVTFDNVPDAPPGDPANTGYQPYIDLILPTNGVDGAGVGNDPVNDGVTFEGATYLGQAVSATEIEFDVNGQAIHPFARDASGNLRVVQAADYGAQPGDTLVVLRLPFGSFTDDQPAAAVSVTLGMSNLADVNVPLTVSAVGGFAFGRDALDNPTADAPVLGATASDSVIPRLYTVTKTSDAPEGETATGPSFPRTYTITLDVATGQTVNDLVAVDELADGIVFESASAGDYVPALHAVVRLIDGPLVGVDGPDRTWTITFHVGEFLAPGDPTVPVLDPDTGAPRQLDNNVRGVADWTPIDTRDPEQRITEDRPGPENVIVAKALAIQKNATVLGPGAGGPGDTVEWTINVQVSDFFSLDSLVLADVLSDGQHFDTTFTPTLLLQEAGITAPLETFDAANFDAIRAGETTPVNFRVGDQLAPDSVLTGGGSEGPPLVRAPTTLVITYRSIIDATFVGDGGGPVAGPVPVLQGDVVSNSINGTATIVGSNPPGNVIADTSSDAVPIVTGEFGEKTIYAINGVLVDQNGPTPRVENGDIVTFRITYTMPITAANDFVITDFLPLPIFTAAGIVFQDRQAVGNEVPAAGVAIFGPTDTFDLANPAGYAGAPLVTTDATANAVAFNFGSFSANPSVPSTIDILFSVEVQDEPFGDGLVFDNLAHAEEANTPGQVIIGEGIADLVLSQPLLNLQKGIVASTNGATVFTPSAVAPAGITFNAPGITGARFTGTISSNALGTGDIDSNISNVDAGDIVTFAIVVENTGSDSAFDITISDVVQAGYEIAPGGLNLRVTDGAGNLLAFTGDLFAGGITLTDGGPDAGALAAADPASGANVLIITYDLRLVSDVAVPNFTTANLATIEHYAALDGGNDFAQNLQPDARQDEASTITAGPGIAKAVVDTSLPQSTGTDVFIGETVTYDVTLTLSEGSIADLVLTDMLPAGAGGKISFVSATLLSVGDSITYANSAITPEGAVLTAVDSNADGILDQITVDFGDTLNTPDNVVNVNDQIVIRITGLVDDLPENNGGDHLTNTAVATFNDANNNPQSIQATASVTIREPGPTITKDVVGSTTVDGGDLVTYRVVVSNPASAGAPAFDLVVQDLLGDPDLSLIAGSVTASGTAAAPVITFGNAAGDEVVTVNVSQIAAGEQLTITYQVRVSDVAIAGDVLLNTASQQSDTAPGDVAGQREFRSNDSAQVNVARPALVKLVTATGLPDSETSASQGNAALQDLAFGETVTFTLTATMPEGVTQSVVLSDLLPFSPGVLEVTAAQIAGFGGNLSFDTAAVAVLTDRNGDGFADTVTITLGNVTNTPDGISNADDQIIFTVNARLISTPSASAGATLTNQGELDFSTPAGPASAAAQASVEIVAPRFAIEKTADPDEADAGDEILYTVRLTNTAGSFVAPGYDITLTDLIDDPNLALVAGSVLILPGSAAATVVSGNTAGDTVVTIDADRLGVGEALIIQYRLLVDDLAPSGTELVNMAAFAADSHPGDQVGERDFSGSAAAVVHVDPPAGVKVIDATSLTETGSSQFDPALADLAIGETVTYRITEALAEGTTSLVIVDNLPTNGVAMHGTAFRLVFVGDNLTLSQQPVLTPLDTNSDGLVDQLTIDFGTIVNAVDNVQDERDWVTVEIDAVVVDDPLNVQGDLLVNTARTFVGGTLVSTLTAEAEVVEPDVLVTKQVVTPAGVRAGSPSGDAADEVTFSVTIRPNPDTMTGPAYNLVLDDLLTPGLELIAGSVTTTRGTIVLGNGASDTQVRLTGLVLLPDDGVVTITYRARLTDAVENGQILTNTADLDYFSSPSADGQTPDVSRLYETSASSDMLVALDPTLDKSLVFTSVPQTGMAALDPNVNDVNQGETIVYRLTMQLGEGTQDVTLTDVLPADVELLDILAIQFGANIAGDAVDNGAPFTITGNTLNVTFGTLVNRGDNLTNADDQITVDVVVRVNADAVPGAQLQNDATLSVASPGFPAVPPIERTAIGLVEVVAPIPVITKDVSVASGDAGDVLTYTVVASLDPASSGPLIHPFVSDPLGPGLTLIAGSVTTTFGTVITGNTPGDTTVLVNLDPAFDPFGQTSVTITYQVRLADTVEPGQELPNTATFEGRTTPVPNPDTVTLTVTDDALVTVVMPVTLQKTVIASSVPETQAAQFNPATPDMAVGEVFVYRLAATLSEGTQHVVITDTLPAGVVILGARASVPGVDPLIAGQTVTADFGIIVNPGNNVVEPFNISLDIEVRLLDVPANVAGTVLVNAASVTIASPTDPGRPGGTQTDDANAPVDVVEPQLVLDKVAPPGFIAAGEDATWTLVLRHDATSTSAAYDITIQDLLAGTDLELVPGSVVVSRGTVVTGNGPGDTNIVYTLDVLPLGETATITFVAHAAPTTPAGTTIINTASGGFDSVPVLDGRPGDVTASASVPMAPGLTKTVTATSIPETGTGAFNPSRTDLAVGEVVTYCGVS